MALMPLLLYNCLSIGLKGINTHSLLKGEAWPGETRPACSPLTWSLFSGSTIESSPPPYVRALELRFRVGVRFGLRVGLGFTVSQLSSCFSLPMKGGEEDSIVQTILFTGQG